jgi:glycosyltransferase involved in cell wall biosynthesis
VKHFSIFKYITIRPEIKEFIIKNFGINSEMIEVIYNPIDENRFNQTNTKDENYILFVGTLD